MNPEKQEQLYIAANRLSHDVLDKFLEANGVDRDKYMAYRKCLLAQPKPEIALIKKRVKTKLLKAQGGICNFCRDPIPHGCTACYDRDHGDVLCQRCLLGLRNVRSLLRAGLTWDLLKKRLGGDENV